MLKKLNYTPEFTPEIKHDWFEGLGWSAQLVEGWETEPLFRDLNTWFLISRIAILRMEPFQFYHWHVDQDRKVAINRLLDGFDSMCLFGEAKNEHNMYFSQAHYAPNTYYIFNTSIPHCVINFSRPRFLLSVEFEDATWSDIDSWAEAYGI